MNTQEKAPVEQTEQNSNVQESFVVVLDPAKTKTPFAAFCANREDAAAVADLPFNAALGARVVAFRGPIEVIVNDDGQFDWCNTMVVNMDLHREGA